MPRRLVLVPLVVALALAGGCGGSTREGAQEALVVSDLRATASAAGGSPTTCPIHFDVAAALKAAGAGAAGAVTAGRVLVEVSTSATPAPDPIQAAQSGMTVLNSAAAVFVRCQYDVGGTTLDVVLAASPVPDVAAAILAPALQQLGHLSQQQVVPLVSTPPAPGSATPASTGTIALARVRVSSGDAALVLSGGGLSGTGLVVAAQDLVAQAARS